MKFERIQLSDRQYIDRTLDKDSIYWEHSFSCIFVWNHDKTYIYKNDNYALIYFDIGDKYVFLPPYLTDDKYFEEAINTAVKHADESNVKFVMRGLSQLQVKQLQGFSVYVSENDSDYVYSVTELAELKGKKFHAKRNFVNRFTSKNNYLFRLYEDSDYDKVIGLCQKWLNEKENNATMEFCAIKKSLEYFKILNLKIGLLFVKDELVAFSVSDIAVNGVAHTLFEKGDLDYEGVYQTVNYLTAKDLLCGCEFVNRQEDMGIEGLRKAKQSYNPVKLVEKYFISK